MMLKIIYQDIVYMVSKKVKTTATTKRGKGDIKQSVKVSVRIGEAKPKRKRQYKRRPKAGEAGDLARIGETRTLYGNLPPPPPQQIIYTQPQLPQAFQAPAPQPQIAGLLEDVKRERQNLLEDIKRETSSQIQKAQGAEQRAELAKAGAFDPFNTSQYERPMPSIEESISTTAPSLKAIMKPERPPIITEPEEEEPIFPFQNAPLFQIEDKPKILYIKPKPKLSSPKKEPQLGTEIMKVTEEPIKTEEAVIMEKEKRSIQAKERRSDPGREKIYNDVLEKYGFPAIKGDKSEKEFAKEIIRLFNTANSGGKKRVTKSNIQNYYGRKFTTLEKLAAEPRESKIPTLDIEQQRIIPLQTQREFNLIPLATMPTGLPF